MKRRRAIFTCLVPLTYRVVYDSCLLALLMFATNNTQMEFPDTLSRRNVTVILTQRSLVLFLPFFHIWRTRHRKEIQLHRSISTLWRPPGRA